MYNKLSSDDRSELESKSIQYLRELADVVGVESPTLMGKEDLIDEILKVLTGGEIQKKKETRGRPKARAKENLEPEISKDEDVVIEYTSSVPKGFGVGVFASGVGDEGDVKRDREERNRYYEDFYGLKNDNIEATTCGKVTGPKCEYLYEEACHNKLESIDEEMIKELASVGLDDDLSVKYGFVVFEDEKWFVVGQGIDTAKKIEITSSSLIADFNLRSGDEIHYILNDDGSPIILSNNCLTEEGVTYRKNFDLMSACLPHEKYKTIDIIDKVAPIAVGSRNVFAGDYDTAKFVAGRTFRRMTKNDKDVYVFVIGIDLLKEESASLKEVSDIFLNLSSRRLRENEQCKAYIFYQRVKRLAELGHEILVHIVGYSKLKELLDKNNKYDVTILGLFNLGSKIRNLGAITTTIVDNESTEMKELDKYYTNKVFVVDELEDVNEIYIDVGRCETLFAEKFLSVEEFAGFESIKKNWDSFRVEEKKFLINNYE